ncbi:MAG: gliding motility protein GldN [Saprospiraceae bacterium]
MKKLFVLMVLLSATTYLFAQPLDDIAYRTIILEKEPLQHEIPNERDILWQKRTWRVIDTREKMNLPFGYPKAPFFDILVRAAESGEITVYNAEKDDFSLPLTPEQVKNTLSTWDTIPVYSDENKMEYKVVETRVFYEDVKRFRVKEMWYFDTKTSSLQVRILGIAPLKEKYAENGDLLGEIPLFWVHYPSSREMLAKELAFVESNGAARTTWEDLFEMRRFASYIYKEDNVRDNRLEDLYSGVELLLEADKIKQEIFNYEHDLWQY